MARFYRKSNSESLGDVIGRLVDEYRMTDKIREVDLARSWQKIVGPSIARHTQEIYLQGDVLNLRIDSSPLKNELLYNKEGLINLVNAYVGEPVVKTLNVY